MHKSIYKHPLTLYIIGTTLIIFFIPPRVRGQSKEEMAILHLFYKEEELVVTPTREKKSITQVAENVSIITEEDTELINAHTLAEVLYQSPGTQVDLRSGPGGGANVHIQGSEFNHVLLLIDNVPFNNLSEGHAPIGIIPVQNIKRIEIIKGPASSSWGSSLGGIINIITKSSGASEKKGKTISVSYGERNIGDYRIESSGKKGKVGYYLYAGNLVSDGFRPHTSFDGKNLYTNLNWAMTHRAHLSLSVGYNSGERGMGEDPEYDLSFDNDFIYRFSTLNFNYAPNSEVALTLSLRELIKDENLFYRQLSTGADLNILNGDDFTYGGTAKLNWKVKTIHNVIVGADFDHGELEANYISEGKRELKKWALFTNDTITLKKFSFTPGIRYDYTNTNGDFFSPSLGITYHAHQKTLIRGYIARGFNIPSLGSRYGTGMFYLPNPDLQVEKVWSVQTGIDYTMFTWLLFKAHLFRHIIWDAVGDMDLPDGNYMAVNKNKQRKQGIEIEIHTSPFYNTSLSTGFAFLEAKDTDTGERLPNLPRSTYDIGLTYNNHKSLKGHLHGHYIRWETPPPYRERHNFIWDLNCIKNILENADRAMEIFFTAHNIFNGAQYRSEIFKNTERWVEGGVRLKF